MPGTTKLPSAKARSASLTSSKWAASFLRLGDHLVAAMVMAVPPITVEREPLVPMPNATMIGVAVDEADVLGRKAEPLDQDLAEDRRVPLALVLGAHQQHGAAAGIEAHLGEFRARAGGALDRVDDAEAAQPAALSRMPRAARRSPRHRRASAAMSMLRANSPQS